MTNSSVDDTGRSFLYLFSVRCLSSCLSLVVRTLISEMFPPLYPTIKLASPEQNGPFISIEMDRIGTGTASLSACQPLSLPACQTPACQSPNLSACQPVKFASLSDCQSVRRQPVSLPACQFASLSVCNLLVRQPVSLQACQSASLSVCQTVSLPACQSASLSVCQPISQAAC